jgi:hypothetical protein
LPGCAVGCFKHHRQQPCNQPHIGFGGLSGCPGLLFNLNPQARQGVQPVQHISDAAEQPRPIAHRDHFGVQAVKTGAQVGFNALAFADLCLAFGRKPGATRTQVQVGEPTLAL